MSGLESEQPMDEFRRGDEAPDARIDGFKVYGGTPNDRARLQSGDPSLTSELDEELQQLIRQHQEETGSEQP